MRSAPISHRGHAIVRIVLVVAALALVAAAVVVLASPAACDPASADAASVEAQSYFSKDADGFRYSYHAVTGTEGLFDLSSDPDCVHNLAAEREDVLLRMRGQLLRDAGVESLEDLRAPHEDTIAALHALGYL